jgi:hypothetical protein
VELVLDRHHVTLQGGAPNSRFSGPARSYPRDRPNDEARAPLQPLVRPRRSRID